MTFDQFVDVVGKGVDAIGVLIIVGGTLWVLLPYLVRVPLGKNSVGEYRLARRKLGRAILLGLEVLIAGDIIRTVAAPSFAGVGFLAVIVLIRTFLSFTLEVEVSGHWPWQRGEGRQEGER